MNSSHHCLIWLVLLHHLACVTSSIERCFLTGHTFPRFLMNLTYNQDCVAKSHHLQLSPWYSQIAVNGWAHQHLRGIRSYTFCFVSCFLAFVGQPMWCFETFLRIHYSKPSSTCYQQLHFSFSKLVHLLAGPAIGRFQSHAPVKMKQTKTSVSSRLKIFNQ